MSQADEALRSIEVLTLELDGELFAIPAALVREIVEHAGVTEVPRAQPWVRGLINVRGKVAPLADLRLRLGLGQRAATVDSRIVVVELELDGDALLVGIGADRVLEVTTVVSDPRQNVPRIGTLWRPEYVRCIARHASRTGESFVVVLDLDRLFRASLDEGERAAA